MLLQPFAFMVHGDQSWKKKIQSLSSVENNNLPLLQHTNNKYLKIITSFSELILLFERFNVFPFLNSMMIITTNMKIKNKNYNHPRIVVMLKERVTIT